MRNGYRVYDADTHVNPAAEILERYVDPDFRPRLAELAPYRRPAARAVDGRAERHDYRVDTKYYRRVLGGPRPGVQDDDAANRIRDMDEEGADVHFLIPGSFMSLVGLRDPAFEVAMIRAY